MELMTIHFMCRDIQIAVHDKQDVITEQLKIFNTFFESYFLNFVRIHYSNQKGIIDVGANIGNHSLFFSEFLNYEKIYCFEPAKENLEILKFNMQNKRCEIFDVALSNMNGEMPLYNTDPTSYGGFGLENFDLAGCKSYFVDKVPVRTLDSYNLQNISMIKMDVEGHELKALEGARQTIINNRPAVFVEELYHGYPNRFAPTNYEQFFTPLNYSRNHINIGSSYMDLWESKI